MPIDDATRRENAALFPGRRVTIQGEQGEPIVATISPLKVRHLRQFREEIGRTIRDLETLGINFGEIAAMPEDQRNAKITALIPIAAPVFVEHCVPLIQACTIGVDVGDLEHFLFPPLLVAWMEESFGGGRHRPWIAAAETVLRSLTGTEVKLSSMLSPSSPAAAGPSEPSSTSESPSSTSSSPPN